MQRLKLFIPLFVFILVAGFFFTTIKNISDGSYDPKTLPFLLNNKPFPTFSLPKLEKLDELVSEKDMIGEIGIVNVWATWCPSCYVEHGYLNYLASQKGIVIYGVNYNDEVTKAQRWLKEKGNPYRFNIFDSQGRLGLDLGITGAPETFVIDHRGFVRLRFQGPLSESVWQEKFQPLFDQLRKEQQSDANYQAGVAK